MTYPKAIVISAALIATAITFAAYQSTQRYSIVSSGDFSFAWAINTATGEVRFCIYGGGQGCYAIQDVVVTP